jgi:hypothetical protein
MAANVRQKLVVLNNDAALLGLLQGYLAQGYVIHQMINLTPFATKVMILYYDPSVDAV